MKFNEDIDMLKIFIWGTGNVAEETLRDCMTIDEYEILCFIDNDEEKQKSKFWNREVFAPTIISSILPDKIVVLTDAYDEIKAQIMDKFPDLEDRIENKNFFYKESLIKRYHNAKSKEITEVLEYIRTNGLDVFNYSFADKYKDLEVNVYFDEQHKLYYVYHQGHKLYISRSYKTRESVRDYYRSILLEQDKRSPHRYMNENFNVNTGDVVVDIGVAEGNFSLEIIQRVSKIYMIEADDNWIEALKLTFAPFENKVIIIKGFMSSYNEGKLITLDSVIHEPVNFIKMDIEGNEWDGLRGAVKVLQISGDVKMAICAYHSDFDQELIENFLSKHNFEFEHSSGYMWFPTKLRQTYVSTSLNRGIIRAYRPKIKNERYVMEKINDVTNAN